MRKLSQEKPGRLTKQLLKCFLKKLQYTYTAGGKYYIRCMGLTEWFWNESQGELIWWTSEMPCKLVIDREVSLKVQIYFRPLITTVTLNT